MLLSHRSSTALFKTRPRALGKTFRRPQQHAAVNVERPKDNDRLPLPLYAKIHNLRRPLAIFSLSVYINPAGLFSRASFLHRFPRKSGPSRLPPQDLISDQLKISSRTPASGLMSPRPQELGISLLRRPKLSIPCIKKADGPPYYYPAAQTGERR